MPTAASFIGSHEDGRISVWSSGLSAAVTVSRQFHTGEFEGYLNDGKDHRITIDGLWGIAFGNGNCTQASNSLFFAAGPNGEADGLYGRIDAAAPANEGRLRYPGRGRPPRPSLKPLDLRPV